jgi:hypothetical protein
MESPSSKDVVIEAKIAIRTYNRGSISLRQAQAGSTTWLLQGSLDLIFSLLRFLIQEVITSL